MKGKRIAAFALALVLGASAAQPALAADWQSKNPLIAHALGEADGKIETNSKEAFLTSWQNGFRAVEADFTYTSDGNPIHQTVPSSCGTILKRTAPIIVWKSSRAALW